MRPLAHWDSPFQTVSSNDMLHLELLCGFATGGKRFSPKNPWIASGGFIKPARRVPPGPGGSLLLCMTCFLCAGSQGGSNKAKSALQCCNLASVSLRVEQSTATCVQNEIPSETRMEH